MQWTSQLHCWAGGGVVDRLQGDAAAGVQEFDCVPVGRREDVVVVVVGEGAETAIAASRGRETL